MINEIRKLIIISLALFFVTSCQNYRKIYIMLYDEHQRELLTNFIAYKKYAVKVNENNNYLIFEAVPKLQFLEQLP
jgi:hypothetical protein